jgi:hypothetical protein
LLASGHAERVAALHNRASRRPASAITLGTDKAYDTEHFVNELRAMKVTPDLYYADQHGPRTEMAIDRIGRHNSVWDSHNYMP